MGSAVYLVAPNGFQDLILSIAMDAEYLSDVKLIATFTLTFFGYTLAKYHIYQAWSGMKLQSSLS